MCVVGAEKEGAVGRWVTFPNALIFICALVGNTRNSRKSPNFWPHGTIPWCFSPGLWFLPSFLDQCTQLPGATPDLSHGHWYQFLPRFSKLPYSSFLELLLTASTCGLQQITLGCWNTQGKAARGRSWSLSIYPIGNDWPEREYRGVIHTSELPWDQAERGTSPASPFLASSPAHILFQSLLPLPPGAYI